MILAFPRSSYHLQLLGMNGVAPDLIIIRDGLTLDVAHRYFPDAEVLSIGTEKEVRGWKGKYYRDVESRLKRHCSDHFQMIIFGLVNPFEKFLVDQFGIENCELWEDGLNYYLQYFNGFWYPIKAIAKLCSGYYRGGAFDPLYRFNEITRRDRYSIRNLDYLSFYSEHAIQLPDTVLFIGQPLIEDRIISARTFQRSLALVGQHYPGMKLHYLAHPREAGRGARIAQENHFEIVSNRYKSAEEFIQHHRYHKFISPFSTTLTNTPDPERCEFLPGVFGLSLIQAKLKTLLEGKYTVM